MPQAIMDELDWLCVIGLKIGYRPDRERGGRMTEEARKLLWRLTLLRSEGIEIISRRDLHQQVRCTARFRRVRSLDGPLAELLRAGDIRLVEPPRRRRRRGRPPGPVYELAMPDLRRRRTRRVTDPAGDAAIVGPGGTKETKEPPAPRVAPPAPASPPRATETTSLPMVAPTHPHPDVAWRVAILWERELATGKPYAGGVHDVVPRPGRCRCCGDPLSRGDDVHCRFCLVAKVLVIMAWKRVGESRQDAPDRPHSGA